MEGRRRGVEGRVRCAGRRGVEGRGRRCAGKEKRGGGKGEEVCREGEEVWREGGGGVEGRVRRCGMLRQNVPTGHAFDCYLWHEFSLFYPIKLQICVSLKGNACTENEPVIRKLSCVPVGRC